jgi:hypothetical protein
MAGCIGHKTSAAADQKIDEVVAQLVVMRMAMKIGAEATL